MFNRLLNWFRLKFLMANKKEKKAILEREKKYKNWAEVDKK